MKQVEGEGEMLTGEIKHDLLTLSTHLPFERVDLAAN